MQEIVWDEELAARAQEWANNCEFRHDPNRNIKRFTMGQNLAVIWSTAPLEPDDGDFVSRINNWFNEVQKYSFGASWSPKTGHYSQLIWGETNLIGCGFSEYKDTAKYNKLYVCNYGPGGNVVGSSPYEIGKPSCKSYGMVPSQRYRGLCIHPPDSAFPTEIEAYEYKQNIITTKTSCTSLRLNSQQSQQETIQQQLSIISKNPTGTPLLLSSFPRREPIKSKNVSSNSRLQVQLKTQNQASFIRRPNSEQPNLKDLIDLKFKSAEDKSFIFLF
ncbi:CRISP/Allergen/PR-1 isoform X2 [Eupeodes corollae]|nr:CRISP/Allergen/PR-1 isoform X2 [Eupeodes corollae]XP_055906369.1 CRISP/Allergen/PR-1 isoform X2 [Eupeodes corollae]XP_055906370.1 CRISP/Allergen/PR-1 isoform X2 [Eupeodes corollae]XP_055906372.1 CRISP/Allergen/PR-1 isoform X2 [Eupeodes corollae]